MPFTSWADFLCGHEGAEDTNKCISDLGGRFKREGIPLESLKGEESILFMGIASDGSPMFLHHITDLGSTRREPEPSIVALVGFQKSTTVVGITMSDCFRDVPNLTKETIKVPSFSKLSSATTSLAFRKVEVSSKSPTLTTLGILPVPPFLIPCIAGHSHSTFEELGQACATCIKEARIVCEDGSKISENSHCHTLVQFMWWAARGMPETEDYRIAVTLLSDPRPSIVKWRDSAISEAIKTEGTLPTTANPTGLSAATPTGFSDALVGALGSLRDTMDAIVLKDPPAADTDKHFSRLPDHLKTLLYRLSHVPGEPEPTAMVENGRIFMRQHTLASATSLLKTALRQKHGLSVMVQAPSVQALRTGQLLWDDPATPGSHSIFQYYSPTPTDCPDSATDLAWHLTSTEGRGVEGSDIKKALKLQPRVANSVFGASRQVQNFACAHGHLYGENCPIHYGLNTFAEWMLSAGAISTIERLASKHSRFFERLLATLDIRVQEYISSCADSATVDEIESSLLNFGPLQLNLRLQNISDLVGPVFPEAHTTPKSAGAKRNPNDGAPSTAKIRTITNGHPHPSLALTSFSEWEKVRRFTSLIPKVGSIEVCGLFHCRQACSSKCEKIHGRLQPAMVSATEAWIADSKSKTAQESRNPQ
jgi:hypothetical protein